MAAVPVLCTAVPFAGATDLLCPAVRHGAAYGGAVRQHTLRPSRLHETRDKDEGRSDSLSLLPQIGPGQRDCG